MKKADKSKRYSHDPYEDIIKYGELDPYETLIKSYFSSKSKKEFFKI